MTEARPPRLSATVLLARDGEEGLELFMVVRHHQIDFASGALVFPGGSLDETDGDPRIPQLSDGYQGLTSEALRLRVSAVREAFEECGVLMARPNGKMELVDGATATQLGERYREDLEAGRIGMADIAERENLRLALDCFVPFAHWITPHHMPKRFDTHFFIAAAPRDHTLLHDGREAVDSIWINPARAVAEADAGKRTVIFPTRLNLLKVARAKNVAQALEHARSAQVVTVLPERVKRDGKIYLKIPEAAGYGGPEFEVVATEAGSVPVPPLD
jgi:8-oxo-dGTP pyrophosphatase MutT (NUDIX family)